MKKIFHRLNSLSALFLALVLVWMVNFIALRNPVRTDLSERNYYSLSERTLNLLDELGRELHVTVFFQEEHDLYYDIENLLEEYSYHSDLLKVEWVDPVRDRARTEKLANQYGLTDAMVVVFELDGKTRKVHQSDIADFHYETMKGQQQPVFTAFRGEQAFSSAIHGLMQRETPMVRFLVGHGERRITDFDQMKGFSLIGSRVVEDNLDVEELMLNAEERIPEKTDALIIAGPQERMDAVEIEMIEEYLSRSGRVIILLDALKETGLEPMLRRWGVALREDFVVDLENTLRGSDVHIRRYNPHPITMQMQSMVQFILPRSVEPLAQESETVAEDRPTVVPLTLTSDKSWSETQVEDANAKFDPNTGDKRGPFSLAVAVERGTAQEMLDVQIGSSRMVVFGDSDFVSNGSMVGGNADLFMSSLNWLLERDEVMAIDPRPIQEIRLSLTSKQLRAMFWVNVAGIPAVAVLMGILTALRRRK